MKNLNSYPTLTSLKIYAASQQLDAQAVKMSDNEATLPTEQRKKNCSRASLLLIKKTGLRNKISKTKKHQSTRPNQSKSSYVD